MDAEPPPELDEDRREEDGPDADPEAVARRILLDQLARQACSRRELEQRLARRNVPEEVARHLLDRFEEVGLVDDAAYARAWVASRQPRRGLAGRALAHELRRKGVEEEVVRDAVAEIDPQAEEDSARDAVRRRLRTMRGLDEAVAIRRLVAMLARKGHGADLALRVVREELAPPGD